jgi:transcriptional regulator with XRE-family HTH domain
MSNPLPKPPIAANLRKLKEHRSITIAEIARQLEVGERLVNAWVSDTGTDPSWPNVVKLAELFEVEPFNFYDPAFGDDLLESAA